MGGGKNVEERLAESAARKKGAFLHGRLDRPVVLVGMPGAGKSKTGAVLAQCLKVPFVDTDREIQQAAGCSVAEIFARDGEQAFRAAEARLMSRLTGAPPRVVATGGGLPMNPVIWQAVLDSCLPVWIQADIGILTRRTEGNADRPLLAQGNVRERLEALFQQRAPVYARAPIHVVTHDGPAVACVLEILEKLEEVLPCRT